MPKEDLVEAIVGIIQFNDIMGRVYEHKHLMNGVGRSDFLHIERQVLRLHTETELLELMGRLVRKDVLNEKV